MNKESKAKEKAIEFLKEKSVKYYGNQDSFTNIIIIEAVDIALQEQVKEHLEEKKRIKREMENHPSPFLDAIAFDKTSWKAIWKKYGVKEEKDE